MTDSCDSEYDNPGSIKDFGSFFVKMSGVQIALGICVALGSVGSYIPQWIKIFRKNSVVGISVFTIFLTTINQFLSTVNVSIFRFPVLLGCSQYGFHQCGSALLGFIQIVGLWLIYFPIFQLFLLYHGLDSNQNPLTDKKLKKEYLLAWILYIIVIVLDLVLVFVSVYTIAKLGACNSKTRMFAKFIGYIGSFNNFFQYLPQIYKTYKMKTAGSYSIPTLLIQAPGGLVNVYFLAFVAKENISTWLTYFCADIQQWVLLILLLYYFFKEKKQLKIKKNLENQSENKVDFEEDEDQIENQNKIQNKIQNEIEIETETENETQKLLNRKDDGIDFSLEKGKIN
ncbi:pq loop repeat protein [Anaeramoeba ignava]|uniref:Pq loop repeat protein n=1 Tax=Anaeramoeba ignava TaxID=1746090 RepID=A0A9Q0LQR3_ANAIG|nr:pq loop repeat protein [Anaeramoeba ignava]